MTDERRTEGLAVGAFLAGIVAGSIGTARRDELLKVSVVGTVQDGDGWAIDCVTDAGFEYTVRVDLTGS